ncbi:MAG: anthranilate phosphoribosyltransferase, partial [Planctomycetota bacterium]
VVHSNGLDEISTAGVTSILELKDGQISKKELNPEDLGIRPVNVDELKVTDAKTSAKVLRAILTGKEKGPRKDIVVLNAAAAIIAGDLADDFESAMSKADASVSDGKALECLEKLIEVSNRDSQ